MRRLFLIIALSLCLHSCFESNPPVPKPKTYFRMDIEEPIYKEFRESNYPYRFEYPDYGHIEKVKGDKDSRYWLNINFQDFGTKLYLSYKRIDSKTRLEYLVNDSYTFLKEHQKLSSGILEREYESKDKRVYGTAFEIKGNEIASPYQFYLTDSSTHFVRGAIYFDFKTNNDSISNIIERLIIDLENLISSFEWD